MLVLRVINDADRPVPAPLLQELLLLHFAEEQELVPNPQSFFLVRSVQIDWHIFAQAVSSHLFGEASALECPVFKEPAGGDNLRTEDRIGSGVEFSRAGNLAPQHRKTFGVPVIQNLYDLCTLIAHTEIAFINDERSAKRLEDAKERRNA